MIWILIDKEWESSWHYLMKYSGYFARNPLLLYQRVNGERAGENHPFACSNEKPARVEIGPCGCMANMDRTSVKDDVSKVRWLPGIQGVNNDMGKLLNDQSRSMKWVMEVLKGRSLFHDSLTSPKSVAKKNRPKNMAETSVMMVFG